MKNKHNRKDGFALVMVMVLMIALVIGGQAILHSSYLSSSAVQKTINEMQSFWASEGGQVWATAMLDEVRVPLEDKFVTSNSTVVIEEQEYTVTQRAFLVPDLVSEYNSNVTVFKYPTELQNNFVGYHRYGIQASAEKGGKFSGVGAEMSLYSLSSMTAAIYASGGAWITRYDDIRGSAYWGQSLKLYYYGGGYTSFSGDVFVVDPGVYLSEDWKMHKDYKELMDLESYKNKVKVFQKSLVLNAPPIDTKTTFNESVLADVKEQAFKSGGLYLDSDVKSIFIDGSTIRYLGTVLETNTVSGWVHSNGTVISDAEWDELKKKDKGQYSSWSSEVVSETTKEVEATGIETIYAEGDLAVEGVVDGELVIGVNGTTTVGASGIIYESSPGNVNPANMDPDTWSEKKVEALDDVFSLISKGHIYIAGDNKTNTNLDLHGAYMSLTGGMIPLLRDSQSPKRDFRLYGSAILYSLEYTENGNNGYGCHWFPDPRFVHGKKSPKLIPYAPYKFYGWHRII